MDLQYFLIPSGRVNSGKVKSDYLQKHEPEKHETLIRYSEEHNLTDLRWVELIWCYINHRTERPACAKIGCTNYTKFQSLLTGYLNYCSGKCSNSDSVVKLKKEEASLAKFGTKNPYQSESIKKKIVKTSIERYGFTSPMKSHVVKERMIQNSIKKTGKPWSLSTGGSAHQTKLKNHEALFRERYSDLEIIDYSEEKFGVCTLRKPSCGHEFTINKWQLYLRRIRKMDECTVCNPMGSFNETAWQKAISEFLTQHNIEFIECSRRIIGGLELDFYLPEHKVAIELDGIYWHSVNFKEPNYHLNKTELCEAQGIQLIHVFEDEWLEKEAIVKSRILTILGKTARRIYARKCEVRSISGPIANRFIEANHLQGAIPASYRYGLFHRDELVSVMTFGSYRRSLGKTAQSGEYEMYRFCNLADTQVIGGASRLLAAFVRDQLPTKIISYADRRWSTGDLYRNLGFTLEHTVGPNFWWIQNSTRSHRFKFTRKRMIELVGNQSLSTFELQDALNITKIYDSGNLKFSQTFNK